MYNFMVMGCSLLLFLSSCVNGMEGVSFGEQRPMNQLFMSEQASAFNSQDDLVGAQEKLLFYNIGFRYLFLLECRERIKDQGSSEELLSSLFKLDCLIASYEHRFKQYPSEIITASLNNKENFIFLIARYMKLSGQDAIRYFKDHPDHLVFLVHSLNDVALKNKQYDLLVTLINTDITIFLNTIDSLLQTEDTIQFVGVLISRIRDSQYLFKERLNCLYYLRNLFTHQGYTQVMQEYADWLLQNSEKANIENWLLRIALILFDPQLESNISTLHEQKNDIQELMLSINQTKPEVMKEFLNYLSVQQDHLPLQVQKYIVELKIQISNASKNWYPKYSSDYTQMES